MGYGFVYVLGNRAMPGIYKIGMTNRAPREHMDELSRSTSVPYEFDLVLFAQVDDAAAAEAEIHETLRSKRVNSSREFFKTSLDEIRATVFECEHTLDICDVEFDLLFWHEQAERERRFTVDHFFSQDPDPHQWHRHHGFE